MLLRLVVQNIFSFKDQVEFNTFPSCKSLQHQHHKIECDFVQALRMSVIYGANGAGKSNLLRSLLFLNKWITQGELQDTLNENLTFRFDTTSREASSAIAVEFYQEEKIYYYQVEFDKEGIRCEELFHSQKGGDVPIFKRTMEGIELYSDKLGKPVTEDFIDALTRIVRPKMLLLSLLGDKYPEAFTDITNAYTWFINQLEVLTPHAQAIYTPHLLDKDHNLRDMVNNILPLMNTGVHRLETDRKVLSEEYISKDSPLFSFIKEAKENPNVPLFVGIPLGEIVNIVYEGEQIVQKKLRAIHRCKDGREESLPLVFESDGTRKLVDYMPLLYAVFQENKTYVVDEIERSMHPMLIRKIIKYLSDHKKAKGQLIFTTHESCLLDQEIFRPDEIWFAEKDVDQSTRLYPLSDFNIHRTANIENGYLHGRYGGIPFLSNLEDLHW